MQRCRWSAAFLTVADSMEVQLLQDPIRTDHGTSCGTVYWQRSPIATMQCGRSNIDYDHESQQGYVGVLTAACA
jgi:hypothetical protein